MACRRMVKRFEPPFGVDGGHAAGAGGGYCLPIDGVLYVSAGEDSIDVGSRATGLCPKVAVWAEVELTFE